jgi:hypothetical protein
MSFLWPLGILGVSGETCSATSAGRPRVARELDVADATRADAVHGARPATGSADLTRLVLAFLEFIR